ncbi:MarR family winged helix-turn-helix transcriptional regulator [Streptomyces sp. RPT161]|uniref:MarR family winged helix-turn-helix transcriptional regulator n=1 Tax=Streptomyces sp. RPT161 TaxID=3015993 RepID=UPI0022B90D14|nr:MarR family transcriptional regulator [Streptomyces sp. RPT161]
MDNAFPTHVLLQGLLRLGSRLRHERPPGALSPNKMSVLGHLRRRGPSTPGSIAASEHQQPQSLTRSFAELETDGLITRAPSEEDRRVSVLSITEAGRQALAQDLAQREAWLTEAMGPLTETEQQVLLLAGRLMNRLADTPPTTATRKAEDADRR